jgi:hypothetical protein
VAVLSLANVGDPSDEHLAFGFGECVYDSLGGCGELRAKARSAANVPHGARATRGRLGALSGRPRRPRSDARRCRAGPSGVADGARASKSRTSFRSRFHTTHATHKRLPQSLQQRMVTIQE